LYKLITVEDTVRVPPKLFGLPLKNSITKILMEKYEGLIDKDFGYILSIGDIKEVEEGQVVYGDGAAYHKTVFDILAYEPELYEIIEGDVVDVVDFGLFVRLGPLDGLIHISQIMDDFVSYDPKRGAIIGKETGRVIEQGDKIRARIVAVSLKESRRKGSKIALTMRQEGLGKLEWIEEDKKKRNIITKNNNDN